MNRLGYIVFVLGSTVAMLGCAQEDRSTGAAPVNSDVPSPPRGLREELKPAELARLVDGQGRAWPAEMGIVVTSGTSGEAEVVLAIGPGARGGHRVGTSLSIGLEGLEALVRGEVLELSPGWGLTLPSDDQGGVRQRPVWRAALELGKAGTAQLRLDLVGAGQSPEAVYAWGLLALSCRVNPTLPATSATSNGVPLRLASLVHDARGLSPPCRKAAALLGRWSPPTHRPAPTSPLGGPP